MAQRVFTIASIMLGAVPATVMGLLAGLGLTLGALGRLDGLSIADVALGLALLAWGVLGIFGAIALWISSLRPAAVDRRVAGSLAGGIVAMLVAMIAFGWSSEPVTAWLTLSPVMVAAWHLWRWRKSSSKRSGQR